MVATPCVELGIRWLAINALSCFRAIAGSRANTSAANPKPESAAPPGSGP